MKTLTEGAVTTEAGSLSQYFTTLTKKADPLLWQWVVPCRGAVYGRVEWEGEKNKFGSISKRPVNNLNAVIRSARIRGHCLMHLFRSTRSINSSMKTSLPDYLSACCYRYDKGLHIIGVQLHAQFFDGRPSPRGAHFHVDANFLPF